MDRYHAVMGEFYVGPFATSPDGTNLGEKEAVFTIIQRKCPFAPVLGHSTLSQSLFSTQIDAPHVRYLKEDRASLNRLAERLQGEGSFLGEIRLVPEGTIIFAGEPFADVKGNLWNIQLHELKFEHAFDLPMTVGYRAMKMREAAGPKSFLSDFSLRREGDSDRSLRVSWASYISGFDDTSDMDAALQLGIPDMGTMAHYLPQSFIEYLYHPEIDPITEKPKHFEMVAFERWLDANPKGTTLLLCTFNYETGIIHAIQAALSSPARKAAFRFIRLDLKEPTEAIEAAVYCRKRLDLNGLQNVGIVLTGDLDAISIGKIRTSLPFPISGYGVGTKLSAEGEFIAGVIFKMSLMNMLAILKGTSGKGTLPGQFQLWRCVDSNGNYAKDIISLIDEPEPTGEDFDSAVSLLAPFWGKGVGLYQNRSPEKLKRFFELQLTKFKVPLEKYPVVLSPKLAALKQEITEKVQDKNPPEIKIPED